MSGKKIIKSFLDLNVYKNLFDLMEVVIIKLIPKLPKEEKYDLADQIRRACKAPTVLLAEGFAKRHQKKQWSKYLDDCVGECYEMMNHLAIVKSVYHKSCNPDSCQKLIDKYEICCKQLTRLKQSWVNYHDK